MRHIDYAVKSIQRALTKVESDRFTPAFLSSEISDYLIDLTVQYPEDGSEFSKFVISLPYDAIENELTKQMLPENLRQRILDYRVEHEALQIKKENHIVEHGFDQAAKCRDQQDDIVQSILLLGNIEDAHNELTRIKHSHESLTSATNLAYFLCSAFTIAGSGCVIVASRLPRNLNQLNGGQPSH